jgi:eukaryotic-like serine/threonine-protein kinase
MTSADPFPEESAPSRLGRYRLIATLGQGGMGTIHLAVAGGLGGFRKLFVVKVLKAELTHNSEFLRLFMREARLAARLNHANVVHTIEADQDAGRYFLAMEFLDGQPFSEILRRAQLAPALPLALRLQVVCHALTGLHHAHEIRDYDGKALQIVHRDVSPTNIFVTYDGEVKVLDFGIARAGDAEGTQPRAFKGKIGYAAPEQLRMRQADRRSDVFAAGVVMWEAIALRHLVRGKLTPQVFEARVLGTEPRIGQLLPELEPALAQICDRAMHLDPEQRYPSAEAMRLDLQNYLSERALMSDATVLAQLMRTKFAEERKQLYRVIEDQLANEEDISHSFVATRNPAWFPPALRADAAAGDGQPGADEESKRARSWQPTLRYWLVGALVLIAAAVLLRIRLRADEDAPATPATRASAPAPAPAHDSIPAQARETVPAAEASMQANEANEPPKAPHTSAASAAPARRSSRTEASPAQETRAPNAGTVPSHSDSDQSNHGTPASVVAPGARETPRMDVDLRGVRPAARRTLDVDNPFH